MIRTRHRAALWCSVLMKIVAAVLLIRAGLEMLYLLWVWWHPSHLMSMLDLLQSVERLVLTAIVPSSLAYAASVALLLVLDIELNTRRLLAVTRLETFLSTPLRSDPLPTKQQLG